MLQKHITNIIYTQEHDCTMYMFMYVDTQLTRLTFTAKQKESLINSGEEYRGSDFNLLAQARLPVP